MIRNAPERTINNQHYLDALVVKVASDLTCRTKRGTSSEINKDGELKVEDISSDFIRILGLEFLSEAEKLKLSRHRWLSINDGQAVVQIMRDLPDEPELMILVDYDDTLMNSTLRHTEELEKISRFFAGQDIDLSLAELKRIYNDSKIFIPGKAEKEARYTPALNIVLLDFFLKRSNARVPKEQVFEELAVKRDEIIACIIKFGDNWIIDCARQVDSNLLSIFIDNSPSQFVYKDVVADLLSDYDDERKHEVKAIITRGATEGPSGQVHKVNSSGSMEGLDFVVYINDLKSELIPLIKSLFCSTRNCRLIIYDNNPYEINDYFERVIAEGISSVELVWVRHPDSRRAELDTTIPPSVRIGLTGDQPPITTNDSLPENLTTTVYDHYFPGGTDDITN